MLEFNEILISKVDSLTEIPYGDEMEVEIRANNLVVIDYIYNKLILTYTNNRIIK